MKFELIVFVTALLSQHFSNVASLNNTTTAMPTSSNITTKSTNSNSTCYVTTENFKQLNSTEVINALKNQMIHNSSSVIQTKMNQTEDMRCGLQIIPKHNDYKFNYAFFTNETCNKYSFSDTICQNSTECSGAAIKCCKPEASIPCNVYSITPINKPECKPENNTECFQITSETIPPIISKTTQPNNAINFMPSKLSMSALLLSMLACLR